MFEAMFESISMIVWEPTPWRCVVTVLVTMSGNDLLSNVNADCFLEVGNCRYCLQGGAVSMLMVLFFDE